MPAPPLRPLPPPTWDVVFPPNTGHGFFQDAAQHPFAANAGAFVPVDSWWLSELSLLAYSPAEAAGSSAIAPSFGTNGAPICHSRTTPGAGVSGGTAGNVYGISPGRATKFEKLVKARQKRLQKSSHGES